MGSIISPQFLKRGDSVGIIAPARRITEEELAPFTALLLNAGLNVVKGSCLSGGDGPFSGTVEERLADIHKMFMDPNIKALFAARGGYGTAQLLLGMDWGVIRENPKWLVGFSDVTALHSAVGKFMETLHGVMPYSLVMNEPQDETSFSQMLDILTGGRCAILFPTIR